MFSVLFINKIIMTDFVLKKSTVLWHNVIRHVHVQAHYGYTHNFKEDTLDRIVLIFQDKLFAVVFIISGYCWADDT